MKTVLLIDDELDCLKSLGEIISYLGHQVIARPDAKAALTVLRESAKIDLVITDYRMPEMDGLEFIILMKRIFPSVPIILLTGYGEIETYLKSLSLGVFEFVNKPVRVKELDRIVKAAIIRSEEILMGE
jgi:two-component system, response regulator, stage 0 sporulation protein F